jgi:hypothetical protein
MGEGAVSRLTGGRDGRHIGEFVSFQAAARLFGVMATAAQLLRRLDEQRPGLRRMVDGVARQATEMSLDVGLADFRFVTASAAGQNQCGLHAGITFDEFGIAGTGMFRTRPVATFATAGRGILAFQRLRVGRLGEGFVYILMTSLADLDADILGILVGVRWRILRERIRADEREARQHQCEDANENRDFHKAVVEWALRLNRTT